MRPIAFVSSIALFIGVGGSGCSGGSDGSSETGDGTGADGTGDTGSGDIPPPMTECGNGVVEPGELCDDGNTADGDACPGRCNPQIVSAGQAHTCARTTSGAVRCWGGGSHGHAGAGAIGDDEEPASAGDVPVDGTVVQVAAALGYHTCVLLDGGTVRCWGASMWGELGYPGEDGIDDAASAGDVDLGGTAVQVATGSSHTCAVLDTGAVRCWGRGNFGLLGYGNDEDIGDDETPAEAGDVPVGGAVVQIAVGGAHTCALLDTGAVRCWGAGEWGRLGYGNVDDIGDDETPASAGDVDIGGKVLQIDAGTAHTCALLEGGGVRCWGRNFQGPLGQPGIGDVGNDETPASVGDIPLGGTAIQVSAGLAHSCAVLDTGAVRCWGYPDNGRLGYGNTEQVGQANPPSDAGDVDVGDTVVQVSAGYDHTCAALELGRVRCWGLAQSGRLGYGNLDDIGDDETPASAGDVPY